MRRQAPHERLQHPTPVVAAPREARRPAGDERRVRQHDVEGAPARPQRDVPRVPRVAPQEPRVAQPPAPLAAEDIDAAERERAPARVDLRSRLEEAEDKMREMQAAHEVEKVELRDYYQTAMGELDEGKKAEAGARIKEEENRTLMQSSVRVVAGQLDDIKSSYSSLRDLMSQLRGAFLPPPALDLFFHDARSTDFTNEPAGDARARKQLPDHAFCSRCAGCVLFVHERLAARR